MRIRGFLLTFLAATWTFAETTNLQLFEMKADMTETQVREGLKKHAITASEKELEVKAGQFQFQVPKTWSAAYSLPAVEPKTPSIQVIWNLEEYVKSLYCSQCIQLGLDTLHSEKLYKTNYKLSPKTTLKDGQTWRTYEQTGRDGIYYLSAYATIKEKVYLISGRSMAKDKAQLQKAFQQVFKSTKIQ